MRLEHDNDAVLECNACCLQCDIDLGRMMTIVVVDLDTVLLADEIETAIDAFEALQRFLDRSKRYVVFKRDGYRRKGVLDIENAGLGEGNVSEELALMIEIECCGGADLVNIVGASIGLAF